MRGKRKYAVGITLALLLVAVLGNLGVTASAADIVSDENTISQSDALKIWKNVTQTGKNSDSFAVNEPHVWIIRGTVPGEIRDAKAYIITDTMDPRLTYQKNSVVVKLYTKAGEEQLLDAATHYRWKEERITDGEYEADRLRMELTGEGQQFVSENLGAGGNIPEIRVYFRAVINETASMGTCIPDDAQLEYISADETVYHADSDGSEVHTGGIHLLKTDANHRALPGAVFRIGRLATEAELADRNIPKETVVMEEAVLQMVYVNFYAAPEMQGEKVSAVSTDENGKAAIYGLAYGTYYIVECAAPSGYNLLTQPITVIIDEASHLTAADGWKNSAGEVVDNTVHILNTKFNLPDTGGVGTVPITVTGMALLASAGILLITNRKKRM